MHKFFIIVLCACFLFQDDEVTITWSEDLTLQWSDFKGEPKPVGDAVAITASGISFGYSTTKSTSGLVDYSFQITAHFYPEKSWRINKPLSDVEKAYIIEVLNDCHWRIGGEDGAAKILGLPDSTLRSRMKKLQIHRN